MRSLLAAFVMLWSTAVSAGGITAGSGHYGSTTDLGGSSAIRPDRNCWTDPPNGSDDILRWTRARLAACDGCLAFSGPYEQGWGLVPQSQFASSPPQTSTCFALNRTSGKLDFPNASAYRNAVKALVPSGHTGPLFVAETRFDLISEPQAQLGGAMALQPSMFLRTPRTWANFTGWFDSTHGADDTTLCGAGPPWNCQWSDCRAPLDTSTARAGDKWNAGDVNPGCNHNEWGQQLPDALKLIDPVLATGVATNGISAAVRYSFGRNTWTQSTNAVMADRLDPAYQAWAVNYAKAILAAGWDMVSLTEKLHFFVLGSGTKIENWPDTSDALGGNCTTIKDYGATIAPEDIITGGCGIFSGPMQRANASAYELGQDILGQLQLARLFVANGIPFHRTVKPNWWKGCNQDASQWTSPYDVASCTDISNEDSATAGDETAMLREIAQLATVVEIDIAGSDPASPDIASAGWSYKNLKNLLEHPPTGAPATRVVGWTGAGPNNGNYATPPKVGYNPSETNPGTAIPDPTTPPAIPNDVFIIAGQSLVVGHSTQNQGLKTGNVTSPTSLGLVTRLFNDYYAGTGGAAKSKDMNDWPCADTQCIEAGTDTCVSGTCANECAMPRASNAGCTDVTTPFACCTGLGTGTCDPIPGCVCDCGVAATAFGGRYGSPWPAMAKAWMEQRNREITFISMAQGASCLVYGAAPLWDPTVDCSAASMTPLDGTFDERGELWCALKAAIPNSTFTPKAMIWAQGECDSVAGYDKAAYKTALTTIVNYMWTTYQIPTLIAPLTTHTNITRHGGGSCSAVSPGMTDIRAAQMEIIGENPHAYVGASYDNIELESDCTHIYDNQTWGYRWAETMQAALAGLKFNFQAPAAITCLIDTCEIGTGEIQ